MMLRLRKMELTELFSGFKNKKQRRMAQSKVINGFLRLSMSETGATIAKKVSASSTTKMETSTRACGQLTNVMVRGLTGKMKTKN
jgi:hypothetical protein